MDNFQYMSEHGLKHINRFKNDIKEDVKASEGEKGLGLILGAYGFAHCWMASVMTCALSMPDATEEDIAAISEAATKAMTDMTDMLKLKRMLRDRLLEDE